MGNVSLLDETLILFGELTVRLLCDVGHRNVLNLFSDNFSNFIT